MKQNKLFITFILIIIFSSCTFSKSRRAENIYFNQLDESSYYNIELIDIHIYKTLGMEKLEENARYIINLLLNQYKQEQNIQVSKDSENGDNYNLTNLYAEFIIKEESFIKDFETINTSTLEIRLYKEEDLSGEPEIISLLTVDTKETITSYKFLYTLVERSLGRIFP